MTATPNYTPATIDQDASESDAIDLGDADRLHRVDFPDAWTAASLTFLVAPSAEGPFLPLYSATAEYVLTAAGASKSVFVDQGIFFGIRHFKVRSGVAGAAVNQAAARDLKLVTARG